VLPLTILVLRIFFICVPSHFQVLYFIFSIRSFSFAQGLSAPPLPPLMYNWYCVCCVLLLTTVYPNSTTACQFQEIQGDLVGEQLSPWYMFPLLPSKFYSIFRGPALPCYFHAIHTQAHHLHTSSGHLTTCMHVLGAATSVHVSPSPFQPLYYFLLCHYHYLLVAWHYSSSHMLLTLSCMV
jgi:hypothetical protein